jgi:uncharacterized protein
MKDFLTPRIDVQSMLPRLCSVGMAGLSLAFALWSAPVQAQPSPQRLPTISLSAGMHIIKAEVALTPEQHQIGLMHRTQMATNEGMLFVFDRPGQQCFWMKNTLIPLQIAFVADDGTVVNLAEMTPKSLDSHCSTRPVRFVLEMNTGWFTKRGIQAGSRLRGEPFGTPR